METNKPVERLWPLVNEAVAKRAFDQISALEYVAERRCLQQDYIPRHTLYYWLPALTDRLTS